MLKYRVSGVLKPLLAAIDLVGNILFFWTKFKPFPKNIKKILLIRVEHIGDVLLTAPTFRALRHKFPKAKIDVLARSFSKEILHNNKDVNVVEFNPPWLAKGGSLNEVFEMISKLRKDKYDIIIDLHGDPRNIIFACLSGSYRIGFGIRGFGFLLNKVVKYDSKVKHAIERNLDIVRAIGADTKNKSLEINLSKNDLSFANKLFKKYKIKKAICINPGAGRKEKMWLNKNWSKVSDHAAKKGYTIIFTGSKSEQDDVKEIIHNMDNKNYVNLCGKTNLKELSSIIKKCRLFLGPDTGPMHIAKAVNTPIIAIFGPENPKIWGYQNSHSVSLKAKNIKTMSVDRIMPVIIRFLK